MKQLLILLLSLTLCLGGLTACGGDKKTDPGTNSGSGSVIDPDGSLMDPEDDILEHPSAPNASQDSDGARSGRTAAQRETLFRPASYRQMLRNAQVHDRDGNLRDGENSVTPGILH